MDLYMPLAACLEDGGTAEVGTAGPSGSPWPWPETESYTHTQTHTHTHTHTQTLTHVYIQIQPILYLMQPTQDGGCHCIRKMATV